METQLIIRIDKSTKQKFSRIARTEGKTASTKIRELVSSYIEENDYTVNKALPEATIEKMRDAFARGHEKHLATVKGEGVSRDAMLALFNRRFLKLSKWTDGEIDALGDLSLIEETRLQELLDQKTMQKMGLNGNRQKVVPVGEVKRYIEEGWEYLSTLPSGEAVVRLPPQ